MIRLLRQHLALAVAGIVFMACLIGIFVLNINAEPTPSPQRVASSVAPPFEPDNQPPETSAPVAEEVVLVIPSSAILSLSIPSIALDVNVSGETSPRKTANCKESEYCIDPPVSNEAAWYGSPPSLPSVNPVLLFGHTSWSSDAYATFNNLPAVVAGDQIFVTTTTGVFIYQAEAPTLVPYVDASKSEVIFGDVPEKLVLATCNNAERSATVVVAYLVDAILT